MTSSASTSGRHEVVELLRRDGHRVDPSVWALRLLAIGVPVAVWATNTSQDVWSPAIFASPEILWGLLYRWFSTGFVWPHIQATLHAVSIGFVIGAITGGLLALGLAFSRTAWALLQPFIVMGNAVPRVVLAPILTLWLGFGVPSKFALVAIMVFFPNFFNIYKGLTSVEVDLLRWTRSLGAKRQALVKHVYVPSALVWMLASLRTSIGFAFLAAIVGEFVGATKGIGYLIAIAGQTGSVAEIFAGILVIMAMVVPLNVLVVWLDRRLERWRPAANIR